MRLIGTLSSESDAARFGDYLADARIRNSVEENNGTWEVWVEDDDQQEAAKLELAMYLSNPADPGFGQTAAVAKKIRVEQQKQQQRLRSKYYDVRTHWASGLNTVTPVTYVTVAICVIVAVLSRIGSNDTVLNPLRIAPVYFDEQTGRFLVESLDRLRHGEIWRAVTPIFIHFGVMHLIFNMMAFLSFGSQIEARKGSIWLVSLILLSAIPSNFAQYIMYGPSFGGMSGVVYALFGYLWMKDRYAPQEGMHVHPDNISMMLIWFVLCLTGLMGPIANTAHAVGLGMGIVMGAGPFFIRRQLRRMRR